jgi:tripartite-type tricarboxylate transporter receptor subunit TctC
LEKLRVLRTDNAADIRLDAIYIRAGKLRPLAVTTARRWEGLPDSPTVGDFLPGYEAFAWLGIGAPNKTPAEIVDKLNKEINARLADPKLKAPRLRARPSTSQSSSPSKPKSGPR